MTALITSALWSIRFSFIIMARFTSGCRRQGHVSMLNVCVCAGLRGCEWMSTDLQGGGQVERKLLALSAGHHSVGIVRVHVAQPERSWCRLRRHPGHACAVGLSRCPPGRCSPRIPLDVATMSPGAKCGWGRDGGGTCGDEDGRKEVGVGGAVGQPELEPGRVRDPVAGRCFDLDFKALTRVATPGGRVCVLWDHVGPCVAVCARGRGYSLVLPAMGDCSELAVPTGPCGCGCSRCTRCSSGPRTRRRQSVHCSTAATDTTGCLLGCLAPLTGRARGQRLLQGQQWKKEKRGAMSGGGSA